MTTDTTANRRAAVERGQAEILADVAAGVVPHDVASFAALHDHVDANTYGGLAEMFDPEGAETVSVSLDRRVRQ
jgi:hypothetical protein